LHRFPRRGAAVRAEQPRRRMRRRPRSTGPSPSSSYRADSLSGTISQLLIRSLQESRFLDVPTVSWSMDPWEGRVLDAFAPLKPRDFEGLINDKWSVRKSAVRQGCSAHFWGMFLGPQDPMFLTFFLHGNSTNAKGMKVLPSDFHVGATKS